MPPARPPKPFTPPTPAQLDSFLRNHPVTGPSLLLNLLPVAGSVVLILLLTVAQPGLFLLIAPWIILAALFISIAWRAHSTRTLDARVNHASELAMFHRHVESLRLAWRTLPMATRSPEMHGRLVTLIAHDLDQVAAYDSAINAYSYILERMPREHPAAIQLRLHRAMAQLANDQLTDADDTLMRLRTSIDTRTVTPLAALFRLASLTQQVRTLHYQDAIDLAPSLIDDLRPLGVAAAFGHALMAWSYHNLPGISVPDSTPQNEARLWWERATILLPADTILRRFKDLAPLREYR